MIQNHLIGLQKKLAGAEQLSVDRFSFLHKVMLAWTFYMLGGVKHRHLAWRGGVSLCDIADV